MLYQPVKHRKIGLDFARALAISLVLLSHVRYLISPHWELARYCRVCGFFGVALFFIFTKPIYQYAASFFRVMGLVGGRMVLFVVAIFIMVVN